MEMQVYIANLGKYNEGELVGAWFTPPIDFEDMKERIGLNDEYEEYAIHDYEAPFDIGEYTSIDEINRLYEMVEEIEGSPIYDELKEIQGMWFNSLEELLENKDDIICYSDCDSMEDVAYGYVEEGHFVEIPERLWIYLDYKAIARDLEINGNFLVTSHGVFEYVN
ncbi:antirestriction protein ArdA [Candidatus Enterococcus lemimoniae]|uniref:Antirestriction protein ArdA n=1 Tax=Candidatus Enterococcus lemimoniae TaxID=1834167 RepID=A0ABZ2T7G6_9ENTE|nr:antirestriction protein ArdA [Enterococcus sp. 12C11_DIV0727]OTO67941.1 antirestriction protein ArdA [Enterococcus sp. 12C11_DIV0727]